MPALYRRCRYELRVLGHSLGGGVAALIAMLLRGTPELRQQLGGAAVTAVTFATPPVVTGDLAESCRGFVTCVVNQNDMVGGVGQGVAVRWPRTTPTGTTVV